MIGRYCLPALLALAASTAMSATATAADHPFDAKALSIDRTTNGVRLKLASRDASFGFPVVGSDDDPTLPVSGGLLVEVFTLAEALTGQTAPSGLGNPGWTVANGRYRYRNRQGSSVSAFRSVSLRQGRLVRIALHDSGLAATAPLVAVAVRVTSGAQRSCTVFQGDSIRRDTTGRLRARNGTAAGLADCSDASVLDALTTTCSSTATPECIAECPSEGVCALDIGGGCSCVFPTEPCGDTAPVCNGECAVGEECVTVATGFPFPGCACTPIGVTPCAASEPATCGGECSGGQVCTSIGGKYGPFCACIEPDAVCGDPGFGSCEGPFECVFLSTTRP